MQVYKAFFKVIYRNSLQMLIYVIIFLFLTIILSGTYKNPVSTDFTETKVKLVFINNDGDSNLSEGLRDYLRDKTELVELPDDTKILQDALFFRDVEYIIRVPKGFTKELLLGGEPRLEINEVPDSGSGFYMKSMVNKYINTAKTYGRYMNGLSEKEISEYVKKDLSVKTKVQINSFSFQKEKSEQWIYYYNYLAYSIFAVLILGVCSVMIVFNNKDLKKRNLCSPVKLKNINFQLIAGNMTFAVLTWLVMISASFLLFKGYMFTATGGLFLLNSFVITIAALSISFLIGNLIKGQGAMSAVANVVSLGSCFISGVFVPQALLGKSVLTIASFTPVYWYVKSNNYIGEITNFNMENLMPFITNTLIILGFAAAFTAITLALTKQKSLNN